LKNLKYLKNLLGDNLLSTTIIYDGSTEIDAGENKILNFRNFLHAY
jgi:hypothetical protein